MRSRITEDDAEELNGISREIGSLIRSLAAARKAERTAVDEVASRLSQAEALCGDDAGRRGAERNRQPH